MSYSSVRLFEAKNPTSGAAETDFTKDLTNYTEILGPEHVHSQPLIIDNGLIRVVLPVATIVGAATKPQGFVYSFGGNTTHIVKAWDTIWLGTKDRRIESIQIEAVSGRYVSLVVKWGQVNVRERMSIYAGIPAIKRTLIDEVLSSTSMGVAMATLYPTIWYSEAAASALDNNDIAVSPITISNSKWAMSINMDSSNTIQVISLILSSASSPTLSIDGANRNDLVAALTKQDSVWFALWPFNNSPIESGSASGAGGFGRMLFLGNEGENSKRIAVAGTWSNVNDDDESNDTYVREVGVNGDELAYGFFNTAAGLYRGVLVTVAVNTNSPTITFQLNRSTIGPTATIISDTKSFFVSNPMLISGGYQEIGFKVVNADSSFISIDFLYLIPIASTKDTNPGILFPNDVISMMLTSREELVGVVNE